MANFLLVNNPKVKVLLLVALLAALGAVLSAFAVGSHFQLSFSDGAFSFDFKVATGESRAASVLGLLALAAGLAGIGLYLVRGNRAEGEAGSESDAAGLSKPAHVTGLLHRLTTSRKDYWLGGVCGGLGEHTPVPSWVWRLVFLLLLCYYGAGVLLYVLLWMCLPEAPKEPERPGTPSSAEARGAE